MSTEAEARQQFCDIVNGCVGLAAEGALRAAYEQAIITSGDDLASPQKRAEMDAMSSCALFAREVLRRAGLRHPLLDAPYRIGAAVDDVITILRDAGALHGALHPFGPGDLVIVGSPTHVLWVTGVAGATVTTVQGGERLPDRAECIARIDRRLYPASGGGVPHLDGRPVLWVGGCVEMSAAERW